MSPKLKPINLSAVLARVNEKRSGGSDVQQLTAEALEKLPLFDRTEQGISLWDRLINFVDGYNSAANPFSAKELDDYTDAKAAKDSQSQAIKSNQPVADLRAYRQTVGGLQEFKRLQSLRSKYQSLNEPENAQNLPEEYKPSAIKIDDKTYAVNKLAHVDESSESLFQRFEQVSKIVDGLNLNIEELLTDEAPQDLLDELTHELYCFKNALIAEQLGLLQEIHDRALLASEENDFTYDDRGFELQSQLRDSLDESHKRFSLSPRLIAAAAEKADEFSLAHQDKSDPFRQAAIDLQKRYLELPIRNVPSNHSDFLQENIHNLAAKELFYSPIIWRALAFTGKNLVVSQGFDENLAWLNKLGLLLIQAQAEVKTIAVKASLSGSAQNAVSGSSPTEQVFHSLVDTVKGSPVAKKVAEIQKELDELEQKRQESLATIQKQLQQDIKSLIDSAIQTSDKILRVNVGELVAKQRKLNGLAPILDVTTFIRDFILQNVNKLDSAELSSKLMLLSRFVTFEQRNALYILLAIMHGSVSPESTVEACQCLFADKASPVEAAKALFANLAINRVLPQLSRNPNPYALTFIQQYLDAENTSLKSWFADSNNQKLVFDAKERLKKFLEKDSRNYQSQDSSDTEMAELRKAVEFIKLFESACGKNLFSSDDEAKYQAYATELQSKANSYANNILQQNILVENPAHLLVIFDLAEQKHLTAYVKREFTRSVDSCYQQAPVVDNITAHLFDRARSSNNELQNKLDEILENGIKSDDVNVEVLLRFAGLLPYCTDGVKKQWHETVLRRIYFGKEAEEIQRRQLDKYLKICDENYSVSVHGVEQQRADLFRKILAEHVSSNNPLFARQKNLVKQVFGLDNPLTKEFDQEYFYWMADSLLKQEKYEFVTAALVDISQARRLVSVAGLFSQQRWEQLVTYFGLTLIKVIQQLDKEGVDAYEQANQFAYALNRFLGSEVLDRNAQLSSNITALREKIEFYKDVKASAQRYVDQFKSCDYEKVWEFVKQDDSTKPQNLRTRDIQVKKVLRRLLLQEVGKVVQNDLDHADQILNVMSAFGDAEAQQQTQNLIDIAKSYKQANKTRARLNVFLNKNLSEQRMADKCIESDQDIVDLVQALVETVEKLCNDSAQPGRKTLRDELFNYAQTFIRYASASPDKAVLAAWIGALHYKIEMDDRGYFKNNILWSRLGGTDNNRKVQSNAVCEAAKNYFEGTKNYFKFLDQVEKTKLQIVGKRSSLRDRLETAVESAKQTNLESACHALAGTSDARGFILANSNRSLTATFGNNLDSLFDSIRKHVDSGHLQAKDKDAFVKAVFDKVKVAKEDELKQIVTTGWSSNRVVALAEDFRQRMDRLSTLQGLSEKIVTWLKPNTKFTLEDLLGFKNIKGDHGHIKELTTQIIKALDAKGVDIFTDQGMKIVRQYQAWLKAKDAKQALNALETWLNSKILARITAIKSTAADTKPEKVKQQATVLKQLVSTELATEKLLAAIQTLADAASADIQHVLNARTNSNGLNLSAQAAFVDSFGTPKSIATLKSKLDMVLASLLLDLHRLTSSNEGYDLTEAEQQQYIRQIYVVVSVAKGLDGFDDRVAKLLEIQIALTQKQYSALKTQTLNLLQEVDFETEVKLAVQEVVGRFNPAGIDGWQKQIDVALAETSVQAEIVFLSHLKTLYASLNDVSTVLSAPVEGKWSALSIPLQRAYQSAVSAYDHARSTLSGMAKDRAEQTPSLLVQIVKKVVNVFTQPESPSAREAQLQRLIMRKDVIEHDDSLLDDFVQIDSDDPRVLFLRNAVELLKGVDILRKDLTDLNLLFSGLDTVQTAPVLSADQRKIGLQEVYLQFEFLKYTQQSGLSPRFQQQLDKCVTNAVKAGLRLSNLMEAIRAFVEDCYEQGNYAVIQSFAKSGMLDVIAKLDEGKALKLRVDGIIKSNTIWSQLNPAIAAMQNIMQSLAQKSKDDIDADSERVIKTFINFITKNKELFANDESLVFAESWNIDALITSITAIGGLAAQQAGPRLREIFDNKEKLTANEQLQKLKQFFEAYLILQRLCVEGEAVVSATAKTADNAPVVVGSMNTPPPKNRSGSYTATKTSDNFARLIADEQQTAIVRKMFRDFEGHPDWTCFISKAVKNSDHAEGLIGTYTAGATAQVAEKTSEKKRRLATVTNALNSAALANNPLAVMRKHLGEAMSPTKVEKKSTPATMGPNPWAPAPTAKNIETAKKPLNRVLFRDTPGANGEASAIDEAPQVTPPPSAGSSASNSASTSTEGSPESSANNSKVNSETNSPSTSPRGAGVDPKAVSEKLLDQSANNQGSTFSKEDKGNTSGLSSPLRRTDSNNLVAPEVHVQEQPVIAPQAAVPQQPKQVNCFNDVATLDDVIALCTAMQKAYQEKVSKVPDDVTLEVMKKFGIPSGMGHSIPLRQFLEMPDRNAANVMLAKYPVLNELLVGQRTNALKLYEQQCDLKRAEIAVQIRDKFGIPEGKGIGTYLGKFLLDPEKADPNGLYWKIFTVAKPGQVSVSTSSAAFHKPQPAIDMSMRTGVSDTQQSATGAAGINFAYAVPILGATS